MKEWTIAVFAALAISACATPEPTLCDLAQKYPSTKDPIVASMFGLPTAACESQIEKATKP